MKKIGIIFLVMVFSFNSNAQKNIMDYTKKWQQIDSLLLHENKTKTALQMVNSLLQLAKSQQNINQQAKAYLYKINLEERLTEAVDDIKKIDALEKEITAIKDPVLNSIMQLYSLRNYSIYYLNNSWNLPDLSTNESNKPINQLTKKELLTIINNKAKAIVQSSQILWNTSDENFNSIIIFGKEKKLRNTLYELLAYEIIEQLQQVNNSYGDNIEELNNNNLLFETLPNFIKQNIETTNSNNTVLWLLQSMLIQHAKSNNIIKLIDADLYRLTFTSNYNTKYSEAQMQALNYLINTYNAQPQTAWAVVAKANILKEQGNGFTSNPNFRYKKQEAIAVINNYLSTTKNVDSACIMQLQKIKKQIETKFLSAKLESVNIPNLPFRMLVNFKNTAALHYKIIKLKTEVFSDTDEETSIDINNEKQWNKLLSNQAVVNSSQILPLTNDYQQHNTEVKIDGLLIGKYVLVAASSDEFNFTKDAYFYIPFTVSNLAVIQNDLDLFVVQRDNGQPINKAQVKVFVIVYNQRVSKYENKLVQTLITNENGYCTIDKKNKYQNNYFSLLVQTKEDELHSTSSYVYESYNKKENPIELNNKNFAKAHFFTDRSIYRPQQKVHFKGIVLTKNKSYDGYKLYDAVKQVVVELVDVNYAVVEYQTLTVNEFGSFSGAFDLPSQMLTGNCSIRTKNIDGYTNFKVEEYKRPTFSVVFNSHKKDYELNKIVTLKGVAKAFAGNSIDNAKMSFVVTRAEQQNRDWDFYRLPYTNSTPTQIISGNGITKADGSFEVSFTAIPNQSIDKKDNPIFVYTIDVKITDIKGETREASYDLKVGYNNTIINLSIPAKIDIKDFNNFSLSTTNLQDELIKKDVHIKWQPLVTEQRLIRKRLWEMPDTFVMDKQTYIQHFPNDEYSNEADFKNWNVFESTAIQDLQTFEEDSKNKFSIPNAIVGNTIYKVTATSKDESGEIVSTQKMVEITSDNLTIIPTYESLSALKQTYSVGDSLNVNLYSSLQKIFLIKNIVNHNKFEGEKIENNQYHFLQVNATGSSNLFVEKECKTETSFGIFYAFVQHNRFFTNGNYIEVKKPENKLLITYNSFRNKTLPGSTETYSLTIKGNNSSNEQAELLSSMYDASLDEFYNHKWQLPYVNKYENIIANKFTARSIGATIEAIEKYDYQPYENNIVEYNKLANSFYDLAELGYRANASKKYKSRGTLMASANKMESKAMGIETLAFASPAMLVDSVSVKVDNDSNKDGVNDDGDKKSASKKTAQNNIPSVRKNFNETAFFLPHVYANDSGIYSFTVTLPEALTTWKWQNFAHTKNLAMGLSTQTIITQKTLMVQPNIPRFLTQGDVIELATTIANTSSVELTGTCTLQLFNAVTNTPIDGWFNNVFPSQYFTVQSNGSVVVKFPIQVPQNFTEAITYKIIAHATIPNQEVGYSDGEENSIPVLSNKLYLTNSMPLYLKPNEQEKNVSYSFLQQALEQQNNMQAQAVTLEYTPNTIFTIVKALPYLMEYPFECAEQTFNRFFAYAIASQIVSKNKDVQIAINSWKTNDTNSLKSNLQLNKELKQILLNETPWVQDATNQTQQLKQIASLLDDKNIEVNLKETLKKLQELQLPNGGFSWFKGGRENMYITQYILTGLGKLIKNKIVENETLKEINAIVNNALPLLDNAMKKQYQKYLKDVKKKKIAFAPIDVHYWYMRSFFVNYNLNSLPQNFAQFSYKEFQKNWQKYSLQTQAMLSVAIQNKIFPSGNSYLLSTKINESIIENAIEDTTHDLLYFKNNKYSCYWYENNFEVQTLAIEALEQFPNFKASTQKLKNWLLFNKQTNNWESTVATASACLALLNKQFNSIDLQEIDISIGNKTVSTGANNFGSFKETFVGKDLLQLNSNIKLTSVTKNANPTYGAIYVQYFQPIDDVQQTNHPFLSITKKVFIKKIMNNETVLHELKNSELVNVGDELVIQLQINCQKDLEYVHVKDNRAAGTEPKSVLSEYKWHKGVGYYEATKDASTNFFIDNLSKGNYNLQYSLKVTHTGSFNTGIASIQCLYAPSFVAHSGGAILKVE